MVEENNTVCSLKGCDGTLEYYNGCLGYEAMVCRKCKAHYTDNAIYPNKEARTK